MITIEGRLSADGQARVDTRNVPWLYLQVHPGQGWPFEVRKRMPDMPQAQRAAAACPAGSPVTVTSMGCVGTCADHGTARLLLRSEDAIVSVRGVSF